MLNIELSRKLKNGGKFLYEAVLNGKVISSRTSDRTYVAAIIYTDNSGTDTFIGRPDLIDAAVRKNPNANYLAILPTD